MVAKYVPVALVAPDRDFHALKPGDKLALSKLIQAARLFDPLYKLQSWKGNPEVEAKLRAAAEGPSASQEAKDRFEYFNINRGPWSVLGEGQVFVEGVPEKLKGANYYPEDMTKDQFEQWVTTLSTDDQNKAKGFFYVVRKNAQGQLENVSYAAEYARFLEPAQKLVREAAAATTNDSLRTFLTKRADAFSTNEYADSDIAWMEIDDSSALDITLGPYEVYRDELLNYKASFEAFIALRDSDFEESAKLQMFSAHLQDIEDHLPIDDKYKNPKLGAYSPIVVVNLVFNSGDVGGPQASAFNLPNDEKVVELKGSKRTMLKNVQEQKFERILFPIAQALIEPSLLKYIKFNAFFTHILAHELMHGLGPHNIKIADRTSTVRAELQEIHSTIEEAKADITGLLMLDYLLDKKVLDGGDERRMEFYLTFLAGAFRSIRFGLEEAHGKGQALQLTYLIEKGGVVYNEVTKKFSVNMKAMKSAVKELSTLIMTLQAEGNKAMGVEILAQYAKHTPSTLAALETISSIPVDIKPSFPQAEKL